MLKSPSLSVDHTSQPESYKAGVHMSTNWNDAKAIADAGEKIYNERYRVEYERGHRNEYVAINVLDGSATLGKSGSEALFAAKKNSPTGIFHLIRVGHSGAFEVGLAYRNVPASRLHRL